LINAPKGDQMLDGCTRWPADLAADYRTAGYWCDLTLGEHLAAWSLTHGERIALVHDDERISYRDLGQRVQRLASGLLALGLRPGDRIILQLNTVPEFVYLYYACATIGVIPVMALPQHRFAEISYLAEFTDASAYAAPADFKGFDYRSLGRDVRRTVPGVHHLLIAGDTSDDPDCVSLESLVTDRRDAQVAPERPDPSDVALFLLSGGTTGLPKLIPRTHNDYEYNSRASGAVCDIGPDTVYLVSLPIAHNFPLASPGIQAVLQAGGRVILHDSTTTRDAFELIQRERVTHTSLVPALAIRWLNAPERADYDLSSLRVLQVGGARMNAEHAGRVRQEFGCTLQQVFGMAEGLLNYTRLDDPETEIVTTQGRPCSPADEFRIVDDVGRAVPRGIPGELLARGPYTIRGYYNAPDHNRRAFTPDGYYRTGDVVRQSAGGNLIVEGRTKDLINRGGEKISAEEIENLILSHPAVLDAAVVAMPDPLLGERACAFVILRDGRALTLPQLTAFLEQRGIATFKFPERLELVGNFPLTNVGKVNKQQLREEVKRRISQE
jgi:2,3-dihydroxybenzoate-AMP ligase